MDEEKKSAREMMSFIEVNLGPFSAFSIRAVDEGQSGKQSSSLFTLD